MKPISMMVAAAATAGALLAGQAIAQQSGAAATPLQPQNADPMAVVRGAKSWGQNCAQCHNPRDPKDLSDEQWRVSMTHMRIRAGLTGQEARDILRFLQSSN